MYSLHTQDVMTVRDARWSKSLARRWTTVSLIGALALMDYSGSSVRGTTQTSTWAGSSTDYNLATNWSPNNTVPSNGDAGISDFNVIINSSPVQPTVTSNITIDSLTIGASATLTLGAAITMNIAGPTVTNNGTIVIDTLSSSADLNFTANTSLSGNGTIMLNDYSPNARLTTAVNATLTNGANQTIDGAGELDAALINNGAINANFSGHAISLQTNNMTNNNLFEATAGGVLSVSNITVTQTAGAMIANAGGTVALSNVTINGGHFNGGEIDVSNGTFSNSTIDAGATVLVMGGTTVNYGSSILTNNGSLKVANHGSPATLNFTTNTTIAGTGDILLNTWSPDAILSTAANVTITNSATQTIHGLGTINASLINNGLIIADSTIGTMSLLLQTNNMTNNNLFETANGSILAITGITVTQGATVRSQTPTEPSTSRTSS